MTRLEWLIGAVMLAGALLLTSLAFGHEWYGSLYSIDGINCCSSKDCRIIRDDQIRFEGGQMWIDTEEHGWLPVPGGRYVRFEPPDGEIHACWMASQPAIRCVIVPGQS